jgi:DNA-binding CsgD family transcriptional regulator
MSLAEDLNDVLLSLYRASREIPVGEFQTAALELIKPSLRFTAAQWGTGPITANAASKRSVHLYNDAPDAAAAYEEIKEQDIPVQIALKRGKGIFRYNVKTLLRGKRHAGIRAYAVRLEHQNVILACDADMANKLLKWMSFYRANDADYYTAADRRFAGFVLPHLWEALTINRLTHLEHLGGHVTQRQFELGIADRDGYLYHAEAGFGALVRAEFGAPIARRLPAGCVQALAEQGRYVGRSVVISVVQRADVLFLRARTALPLDKLSARERQIAKAVALGRSHKQIAAELALAPATVRNHIQAIHEKLAVHNAAELIAQLELAS